MGLFLAPFYKGLVLMTPPDLVDVKVLDGGVEAGVEVVEEVDDLKRRRVGRHRREADDVGEVDRHRVVVLGVDAFALRPSRVGVINFYYITNCTNSRSTEIISRALCIR